MPGLRLATLVLLSAVAVVATAQTSPTPYALSTGDYTFDSWPATSTAGTYPANMRIHEASSGQDPDPSNAFAADYSGPYNATSGTRVTGLDADGISMLNTGTNGRLGAITLALDATDAQNIRVQWTGGTAASGSRPYVIRLQYRVGTSGGFTDVGGEYVAAETGNSETFSTVLPSDADGAPIVHVRWAYGMVGSGSGNRPRLRVDDVTVSTSDSPGSGTGTAAFAPDILRGGQAQTVAVVVTGRSDEPGDLLTDVELTVPSAWGAIAPGQLSLIPAQGTASINGSTISITGVSASATSPVRLEISGVAIPDASAFVGVALRTGAGSPQTVAISDQPLLRIWSTPEPISAVRANNAQGVSTRLGDVVTVQAIVTASNQFRTGGGERGPSFFEDASGGLAAFSPDGVAEPTDPGEEVILLGVVDQFFGLNQLNIATTVVETLGFPGEPTPPTLTLQQLASDGTGGVEQYEGRLVRVENVTVNTSVWTSEGSGTNYQLTDASGSLDVRINPGTNVANMPAPTGPFNITGVLSQFRSGAPFVGGYQIMPRSQADIVPLLDAPVIAPTVPFEQAATPTSVTLRWTTDRPSHSEVRFSSPNLSGSIIDEARTTNHVLTLTELNPATVYMVELRSAADADTASVARYPVATRSPAGTTETIDVIFSKSVDASVATGPVAATENLSNRLIQRINAAQASIDLALYSLSGSTGASIASALVSAKTRGVRVRMIMDDQTDGTAPPTTIRNAGIPLINDSFGSNDGTTGLHHNKFAVIDHLGLDPAGVWVMSGSWNPTDPGTLEHQQNVVWIQDGALAAGYTAEFEQMWGGSEDQPNATESRFHDRKMLVAPTTYWIGDVPVTSLFSPQGFGGYGSVEGTINSTLATADNEIALNLNLITRLPIVEVVRERHDAGVDVRGVVGETSTTGSVFSSLVFADVLEFPSDALGLLHHKVAIVDGQSPDSDPVVITGSHNWSRAANERNNENTLFLHSAAIANLYLQEFAARYAEAGGTGSFPTDSDGQASGLSFGLSAPAPNPSSQSVRLALTIPESADVSVRVFNVLGQEVARPLDGLQAAGRMDMALDVSGYAAGVYIVRAVSGTQQSTKRLTVVR